MDNIQWDELIPWINIGVMVLGSLLMFVFYLMSSRPAQLEQRIGEVAYK